MGREWQHGSRSIAVGCLATLAVVAAAALCGCGNGTTVGGQSNAGSSSPAPAPSQHMTPASSASPTARPPTTTPDASLTQRTNAARARAALKAFDRAFYVTPGPLAYWAVDTTGGQATFYRQAEMIEMVEDAYESSGDPAYKRMIVALQRGIVAYFGRSWLSRPYNDDIMWMVIASLRAYELTGDGQYLRMAQHNFDATYARSWSSDLGGGLWWTIYRAEKNVTTNAPAAIAACKLAAALHDSSYLTKARLLYQWVRTHLYDAQTGAVYDSLRPTGSGVAYRNRKVGLTYNQGSFIGAADLLYQATGRQSYDSDALHTLEFTRASLTHRGILPGEAGGPDSNGGGFKGIFCRWAVKFTRDNHISSFDGWFQQNADAAWSHRDARGLMGTKWRAPTSSGLLYAWDCSSAVVLLQVLSAR